MLINPCPVGYFSAFFIAATPFSAFLLAFEVHKERSASPFIFIDILVDPFVADL